MKGRVGWQLDDRRGEVKANAGVPFGFAQGRLLHCSTDGEAVRRFGRDDVFAWGGGKQALLGVEETGIALIGRTKPCSIAYERAKEISL